MQDYFDLATKNGVTLLYKGDCQFCGANTKRGVHECLEIFNLGFHEIDFSNVENHRYKFLIVDAHTLQHSEIHGRWNNHFHLTRLHLVLKYEMKWAYELSPKLSAYLNSYKVGKQDEYLVPPKVRERGNITTTDVLKNSNSETECKEMIRKWAIEVYNQWSDHYHIVDNIAQEFLRTIPYTH